MDVPLRLFLGIPGDGSQEQLMMLHVRARSYGSSPGSFLGWFSSFSMMKRMMLMIGPILLIILFIDGCDKSVGIVGSI